jgi:hypothetical protein
MLTKNDGGVFALGIILTVFCAIVYAQQTTIKSPSASKTDVEKKSAQPEIQKRPLVKEIDIAELSLADLDRRCEDAREERIAQLREAEIAKCLQTETGDQAWCETF